MSEKIFHIKCPYKSADVWRRTGERPTLKRYSESSPEIIFCFTDTEKNQKALADHIANIDGIRDFIERYKNLRNEMYFLRGTVDE